MQLSNKPQNSVITVKTHKGELLIHFIEITYLRAENKKTLIFFSNGSTIETCHLLKWFEEKLPVPLFCRSHNSYMVNCSYVKYICFNQIVLNDSGTEIPLSRDRKQQFKMNLEQFKADLEQFKLQEVYQSILNGSLQINNHPTD